MIKTTTGHAVVVHFCLRLPDRAADQILTVLLRYIIRSGNCSTCGVDQVLLATALYKRRIREVAKVLYVVPAFLLGQRLPTSCHKSVVAENSRMTLTLIRFELTTVRSAFRSTNHCAVLHCIRLRTVFNSNVHLGTAPLTLSSSFPVMKSDNNV